MRTLRRSLTTDSNWHLRHSDGANVSERIHYPVTRSAPPPQDLGLLLWDLKSARKTEINEVVSMRDCLRFHDDVRFRLLCASSDIINSSISAAVKSLERCEEPLPDRCLRMLIAVFISYKRRVPMERRWMWKQIKKHFRRPQPPNFAWRIVPGWRFARNVNKPSWPSSNKVLCPFSGPFETFLSLRKPIKTDERKSSFSFFFGRSEVLWLQQKKQGTVYFNNKTTQ